MGDRAYLYRSKTGWRWHRKADNSETVAASTEGYANRSDAISNYERVSGTDAPSLELLNEPDPTDDEPSTG
jgi:uncharacterized protein YegP (UPF0339 family)